jgi:hypothetical protein
MMVPIVDNDKRELKRRMIKIKPASRPLRSPIEPSGRASERYSGNTIRHKSSLSEARMRRKLWPTAERMTLAASPSLPLR